MRIDDTNRVVEKTIRKNKKSKKREEIVANIHIIHILDSSGSMRGGKFKNAIKGMQEEIETIQSETDPLNYIYTVVQFSNNNRINTTIDKEDPKKMRISQIEDKIYPCSGCTALYDAIGSTLNNYEISKGDKVIVKIFTDGAENDSCQYKSNEIADLIKEKESEGWVITFVGTKNDVDYVQRILKVSIGNTLSYDGSAEGLAKAYEISNKARSAYAKSVVERSFTGEEVDNTTFYSNVTK